MKSTPVVQMLLASAARSSDGASSVHNVCYADEIAIDLDVTAISGTNASIAFSLQWRDDASSGAWYTSETTIRAKAAGRLMKRVATLARYFRLSYTILGTTPEVTFSARASWRE